MRQFIPVKCASALLTGALLAALLPGCAADTSAPVVTEDDLTPSSTVQDVIDLETGGGRNYPYFWSAEDSEQARQMVRRIMEEYHAQEQATLQELSSLSDSELQNRTSMTRSELQEELQTLQEPGWLDVAIEKLDREELEPQRQLDPVVTPQEAANRAGRIAAQDFGADLEGYTMVLSCYRADPDDTFRYAGRTVWVADTMREPIGLSQNESNFHCILDATTGELVAALYFLSDEERAQMAKTPVPDWWVGPSDGGPDPQNPAYIEAVEQQTTQMTQVFAQSVLAEGAAVTETAAEPDYFLAIHLTCDNGKTYELRREADPDGHWVYYDYGGYPLRAYTVWNEAYLQ